jgi:hypothetical protein
MGLITMQSDDRLQGVTEKCNGRILHVISEADECAAETGFNVLCIGDVS